MSNETAVRGIHTATLAVMKEVGVIAKTRTNTGQNYQFRGIDDVVERVGPLMAKHGIICAPRVLSFEAKQIDTKNSRANHVLCLVEHTYKAADGTFEVVTTLGEAMDSGDKAAFKAMSGALKYSHTEYFEIPTFGAGADPESASPELAGRPATNSAPPASRPAARPANAAPRSNQAHAGAVLPNYGSLKGQPVAGQKVKDLEYYANGCRKSLGDPSKARWHEKEQTLLAAIEAEIDAQTGGTQPHDNDEPPPHTDGDAF